MTPNQAIAQIQLIITRLIETGLSNQQHPPAMKKTGKYSEIGIAGAPSLSVSMKDQPYEDIYDLLDQSGAYHVRMLDGALVQMCYRFENRSAIAHRLCVFPAPHLESYDVDPGSYDKDEIYADIVGRSIVHIPIRFDFDASDNVHVDVHHPKSHLTLGQYPNCRIPVNSPLTPARFIKFVLRNFYHSAFRTLRLDAIDSTMAFPETLTRAESGITHVIC
jgi:hypothetical protein